MAQSLKKLQSFFLLTFTIASIASDMSRYMNGFTILDSIIFRNAIELTAITIFCHNHCSPSCGGDSYVAACFRQSLYISALSSLIFNPLLIKEFFNNIHMYAPTQMQERII